jgi:hypothetical protein
MYQNAHAAPRAGTYRQIVSGDSLLGGAQHGDLNEEGECSHHRDERQRDDSAKREFTGRSPAGTKAFHGTLSPNKKPLTNPQRRQS